jgi:type IV pilus assembly protein PilV
MNALRRISPRRSPLRDPSGRARSTRGFALLEALVALLIFAFGVLGVVGLQAALTKAQTGSKFRGDAAFLAQELIGNMWSDLPGLANYTTAGCAAHPRCNAIRTKVAATLPAGQLLITQRAPGLVEIEITWTPPSEEQHRFRTEAAVRT